MSTEKDSRLVDYLYGELSDEEADAFERELESDGALSSELSGLEETLSTLRSVEAEEPSPHLDSLILAHARQVADEEKQKRGWFRRIFASPLAGLVAAGSVAMIVALVSVPTMMMSTSEEAPHTMERSVEQIPSPVVAAEPKAEPPPPEETELDEEAQRQPPKLAKKRRTAKTPAQDPRPAKPASKPTPKREQKADDKLAFDLGAGDDARDEVVKDAKTGAAAGPTVPADRPPAPPVVAATPKERPPVLQSETRALRRAEPVEEKESAKAAEGYAESKKSAPGRVDVDADAPSDDDENLREERGQSMLRAASEEFKRGNPEGGRQILVRALAVVRNAPVHAEIAFRLAQYDLSRGAWGEALRYARIAASAPKFDKRKAAMEIVVEAEKRLREQRSYDQELAPAAPSADTDEAR